MLKASLTQRIALPLVGVVLLLQLGLGAYALDHERQALLSQLDARAARLDNGRTRPTRANRTAFVTRLFLRL